MSPRLRSRTLLLWFAFLGSALAAALAVFRLYQTARQEITAQSERVLQQERTQILERIRTATEEIRHTTIAELTSFHVDGLAPSLRKWDEKNELIVGTFQWDAMRGLLATSSLLPHASTPEEIARLWQEFRSQRSSLPKAASREALAVGAFQTFLYPTSDNPLFPSPELGYQSENLDILTHAGRPADPWAGWAGRNDDPAAPWIVWYQAGPDEPVRGCFIDIKAVLQKLRDQPVDPAYARYQLVEARISAPPGAVAPAPGSTERLPELPAYLLTMEHGDLFRQKESNARLTALTAAALFGLFLVGGAALTLYTRRERRDAERKITFVGQVSHELRTPLTSIRMYADLLAQPELLEQKRLKFAQTIGRESARLGVLVERLLALNELERGEKKVAVQPVDLCAVIRETREEMNSSLHASGLVVETDLPEIPTFVLSDHSTLKQALLNLLENAEKYARDGRRLRLKVLANPTLVTVDVADDGPGIPAAIRHRLFEPFVQGGQSLTNKSPGVGLGLSIARGTLRRIGADLVLLETARGATFQLRLPRSPSPVSTLS